MIVNGNGDFCCCCLCLVFLGKKYHVIRHFLVHQEENETFFLQLKRTVSAVWHRLQLKLSLGVENDIKKIVILPFFFSLMRTAFIAVISKSWRMTCSLGDYVLKTWTKWGLESFIIHIRHVKCIFSCKINVYVTRIRLHKITQKWFQSIYFTVFSCSSKLKQIFFWGCMKSIFEIVCKGYEEIFSEIGGRQYDNSATHSAFQANQNFHLGCSMFQP